MNPPLHRPLRRQCQRLIAITARAWQLSGVWAAGTNAGPSTGPNALASADPSPQPMGALQRPPSALLPVSSGLLATIAY